MNAAVGGRRTAVRPQRWLRRQFPHWLPVVLAGTTVALQIAYPLTSGEGLRRLTIAVVVVFAAASVSHAWLARGAGTAARLLLVAGGVGLLAEAVGVRTGVPFGQYAYTRTLGPEVAGVPVVIPLAWTMMAYPAAVVGDRIARSLPGAVAVAAIALTAWDLFLDPQMVAAGHWVWDQPGRAIAGIPLVNYGGWLVTSLVIQGLLVPAVRGPVRPAALTGDAVPLGLYLWTWVGSVVANLFFLGAPQVALSGGVGMGLVVLWLWRAGRR